MDYRNEWLGACFGARKASRRVMVTCRGENIGPYSPEVAAMFVEDYPGSVAWDADTGEIVAGGPEGE